MVDTCKKFAYSQVADTPGVSHNPNRDIHQDVFRTRDPREKRADAVAES